MHRSCRFRQQLTLLRHPLRSWTCLHWAAANSHLQTVLCAPTRPAVRRFRAVSCPAYFELPFSETSQRIALTAAFQVTQAPYRARGGHRSCRAQRLDAFAPRRRERCVGFYVPQAASLEEGTTGQRDKGRLISLLLCVLHSQGARRWSASSLRRARTPRQWATTTSLPCTVSARRASRSACSRRQQTGEVRRSFPPRRHSTTCLRCLLYTQSSMRCVLQQVRSQFRVTLQRRCCCLLCGGISIACVPRPLSSTPSPLPAAGRLPTDLGLDAVMRAEPPGSPVGGLIGARCFRVGPTMFLAEWRKETAPARPLPQATFLLLRLLGCRLQVCRVSRRTASPL